MAALEERGLRLEPPRVVDHFAELEPPGGPIDGNNLRKRQWNRALKRPGLGDLDEEGKWQPRYREHDLRHTCISRLIAQGVDVKLVQALAGHSSSRIIARSLHHLTDERVTLAADLHDPARQ